MSNIYIYIFQAWLDWVLTDFLEPGIKFKKVFCSWTGISLSVFGSHCWIIPNPSARILSECLCIVSWERLMESIHTLRGVEHCRSQMTQAVKLNILGLRPYLRPPWNFFSMKAHRLQAINLVDSGQDTLKSQTNTPHRLQQWSDSAVADSLVTFE